MCSKERSKNERLDGHELDKNVQRRPRCVLERVAHSVAYHSSLVRVRSFWTKSSRVLGSPSLDILLGVIPGTTDEGSSEDTRQGFHAKEDPNNEGSEHDKGTGQGKRHKGSRSDGKTLKTNCCGVSSSIKGIGSLTDSVAHASHLRNSSSIVTDGTICINSQTSSDSAQHSKGSNRNAIHCRKAEADKDADCYGKNGNYN
nr:hypothetical protein ACMD2_07589 [Ipomoea batatas]